MAEGQIEEVKTASDIVSIIGEHVRLTKSGTNFRGLCPFHSEKTPSFMVSAELQIYKCFGCFPAGQFVKTPFGYHKIEDVVENEYVISGKGIIRKVLYTMKRKFKGNLITVKTSQLSEPVSLTEDHMVYVVGGKPLYKNHYKYLSKRLNFYKKYSQEVMGSKILKYFPIQKEKAGSLAKGMSLLYPIDKTVRDLEILDLSQYIAKKWPAHGSKPMIPPLEVKVDEDLLKLIGYYIAEGSNSRAYIRFSLSSDEEDFANEILKLSKKIFDIEGSIFRRPGRSGLEVTVCNSILASVFANLCGKGAENKHIPFVFQQLPLEKQIVILDAIYRGDGNETKLDSRHKTVRHSITTVSRVLSEQLTDVLLRSSFFPSRLAEKEKTDKNGVHHKIAHTVSWSMDPKTSKFHHIYETNSGDSYWILPVQEVKKKRFSGEVYNLNVEDDHSYVANNFSVANCGEGGDVFTFLEKYDGMEFGEALHYLADKAGIKLTSNVGIPASDKDVLYELNGLAAKLYNYLLITHPVGKVALNYLKEDRKITEASIKTFNIGFAPANKSVLSDFLTKKKKFKLKDIERAGLISLKGNSVYDRFNGRIIFPISDHRGNTIALAGRLLPPGRANVGKYINSPETPTYHKSSSLYGLNITKDFIKKEGFAVITEGEVDLISSFQIDVKNVVAIKGSAFTEGQAKLLSRYTKEVVLALDTDFAGVAASIRGIKILEDEGFEIRVAILGRFKDPDEAARGDPAFYKDRISNSVNIWDFIIDSVVAKYDKRTASGKRKISGELTPILAGINNKIIQEHYVNKLSKILAVSEEAVIEEVGKVKVSDPTKSKQSEQETKNEPKSRQIILEESLISLILKQEVKLLLKVEVRSLVETEILRKILDEFLKYSKLAKEINIKAFSQALPRELFDKFTELVLGEVRSDGKDLPAGKASIKKEINETYKQLTIGKIRRELASRTTSSEYSTMQAKLRDFDSGEFERIID